MKKYFIGMLLVASVFFCYSNFAKADVCFLPEDKDCTQGIKSNCIGDDCDPDCDLPERDGYFIDWETCEYFPCDGVNCPLPPPVNECDESSFCYSTKAKALNARNTTYDSYSRSGSCWCLDQACPTYNDKHSKGGRWICPQCGIGSSKNYGMYDNEQCSCNLANRAGYNINMETCEYIPIGPNCDEANFCYETETDAINNRTSAYDSYSKRGECWCLEPACSPLYNSESSKGGYWSCPYCEAPHSQYYEKYDNSQCICNEQTAMDGYSFNIDICDYESLSCDVGSTNCQPDECNTCESTTPQTWSGDYECKVLTPKEAFCPTDFSPDKPTTSQCYETTEKNCGEGTCYKAVEEPKCGNNADIISTDGKCECECKDGFTLVNGECVANQCPVGEVTRDDCPTNNTLNKFTVTSKITTSSGEVECGICCESELDVTKYQLKPVEKECITTPKDIQDNCGNTITTYEYACGKGEACAYDGHYFCAPTKCPEGETLSFAEYVDYKNQGCELTEITTESMIMSGDGEELFCYYVNCQICPLDNPLKDDSKEVQNYQSECPEYDCTSSGSDCWACTKLEDTCTGTYYDGLTDDLITKHCYNKCEVCFSNNYGKYECDCLDYNIRAKDCTDQGKVPNDECIGYGGTWYKECICDKDIYKYTDKTENQCWEYQQCEDNYGTLYSRKEAVKQGYHIENEECVENQCPDGTVTQDECPTNNTLNKFTVTSTITTPSGEVKCGICCESDLDVTKYQLKPDEEKCITKQVSVEYSCGKITTYEYACTGDQTCQNGECKCPDGTDLVDGECVQKPQCPEGCYATADEARNARTDELDSYEERDGCWCLKKSCDSTDYKEFTSWTTPPEKWDCPYCGDKNSKYYGRYAYLSDDYHDCDCKLDEKDGYIITDDCEYLCNDLDICGNQDPEPDPTCTPKNGEGEKACLYVEVDCKHAQDLYALHSGAGNNVHNGEVNGDFCVSSIKFGNTTLEYVQAESQKNTFVYKTCDLNVGAQQKLVIASLAGVTTKELIIGNYNIIIDKGGYMFVENDKPTKSKTECVTIGSAETTKQFTLYPIVSVNAATYDTGDTRDLNHGGTDSIYSRGWKLLNPFLAVTVDMGGRKGLPFELSVVPKPIWKRTIYTGDSYGGYQGTVHCIERNYSVAFNTNYYENLITSPLDPIKTAFTFAKSANGSIYSNSKDLEITLKDEYNQWTVTPSLYANADMVIEHCYEKSEDTPHPESGCIKSLKKGNSTVQLNKLTSDDWFFEAYECEQSLPQCE